MTTHHVQAAIACCHAAAPGFEHTSWERILGHYDQLVELDSSPVVALNRAIALALVCGYEAGPQELDTPAKEEILAGYHLATGTHR